MPEALPPLAAIPLILLAVLAGVCAAYYAAVWWRITRVSRDVPTLRAGLEEAPRDAADAPSSTMSVAIIVPAHNERDVIARLAASISRLNHPDVRTVFVLDRCTDDTEAVLRAAIERHAAEGDHRDRFEIIINTRCPEGWTGKNHAAHRGVVDSHAARDARLLCFVDADTAFEPDTLNAAIRLMDRHRLDFLSLLSTLDTVAWYERLVQPAAGIELVRQFPLDLVNRADSNRAFANGQFMLFRRDAYRAVGQGGTAHERLRHELLEDLAIARRIKWFHKDLRLGVVLADGLFRCRMYRSWPAFRKGWKRIYTEAARRRPARLRTNAWRLRLIGGTLPAASASAFIAGPIVMKLGDPPLGTALLLTGALGVYAFAGAIARALRAQHAPAWLLALYPVGAWFAASILTGAARDLERGEQTQWAGKSYQRTVRP